MTNTNLPPILLQIAALLGAFCLPQGAHSDGATSTVFRCTLNGVTTFSDRPCDAAAQVYEINTATMNTAIAQPAASATSRAKRTPSRKPEADQQDNLAKHEEKCERYAQSLKEVRSKMRAGYSAGEGERLRIREDKLKNQLRLSKCR